MKYWDGKTVPQAPEGECITVSQYWSPSGDCIDIWKAWDDYCWSNDYESEDCLRVEAEVWLDPSLQDPEVPEEDCYVPIEDQSDVCAEQWETFEEQCLISFDYKFPDSCLDVYNYRAGWSMVSLVMKQQSAQVLRPSLRKHVLAKETRKPTLTSNGYAFMSKAASREATSGYWSGVSMGA